MQLYVSIESIAADDSIRTLVAHTKAPYSFNSLVTASGVKTDLFLALKDKTDILVENTRLAPFSTEGAEVLIRENGACRISQEDFDARQAIAIASLVRNEQEYQQTYSTFYNVYQKMLQELPVNVLGSSIEDTFKRRRARDQYWRQQMKKIKGHEFSSQDLEYVFSNLIVREMCWVDTDNVSYLKNFIHKNGWPVIEEYGPVADSVAWLIVQHADRDLPFQKEVLLLFEARLKSPFFNLPNYAYLYDRVMVNSSKPQRYGTQIHCENGAVTPRQLENKSNLNNLREEMGLDSIENYLALFNHC